MRCPRWNPAADPATWPLSGQGRAAARQIGGRLPAGALLTASDEPKAWQTLDPDGDRAVRLDRRLGEVRRTEEFTDGFRRLRRSYVCGAALDGWEPQDQVARRFAAAVSAALELAGARDVVLAGHGMAMTVWLVRAVSLRDPGTFWAELRSPTFSP